MGFAKAFVAVNRFFGWCVATAGALTLVESVVRFALGHTGIAEVTSRALVGTLLLGFGIVYIRAPLFRQRGESAER